MARRYIVKERQAYCDKWRIFWHENINDATLADAILDRLMHNSYRIELKGESMRKLCSKLAREVKSKPLKIALYTFKIFLASSANFD